MNPARAWLITAVSGFLLLAACSQLPATLEATSPPTAAPSTAMPTEPPVTEPNPPTAESRPAGEDLDLRFANVMQVDFEQVGEQEYRFDVTLYHDDEGEAPNFADAWQVLDPAGNLLGERQLLHSHGTQPFTRTETITIPNGIDTVIVRGHDMTHGYGGQGMRVDLESGQTTPIRIDADS